MNRKCPRCGNPRSMVRAGSFMLNYKLKKYHLTADSYACKQCYYCARLDDYLREYAPNLRLIRIERDKGGPKNV